MQEYEIVENFDFVDVEDIANRNYPQTCFDLDDLAIYLFRDEGLSKYNYITDLTNTFEDCELEELEREGFVRKKEDTFKRGDFLLVSERDYKIVQLTQIGDEEVMAISFPGGNKWNERVISVDNVFSISESQVLELIDTELIKKLPKEEVLERLRDADI